MALTDKEKLEAKRQATDMFAEMMRDAVLNNEDTPKKLKLQFEIVDSIRLIDRETRKIVTPFATGSKMSDDDIPLAEEVRDYLGLVLDGLKIFRDTHLVKGGHGET